MNLLQEELIKKLSPFNGKEREYIISSLIFTLCPNVNYFQIDASSGLVQINNLMILFSSQNFFLAEKGFNRLLTILSSQLRGINLIKDKKSFPLEEREKVVESVFKEYANIVQEIIKKPALSEKNLFDTVVNNYNKISFLGSSIPSQINFLIMHNKITEEQIANNTINLIKKAFPFQTPKNIPLETFMCMEREKRSSYIIENGLKESDLINKLFYKHLAEDYLNGYSLRLAFDIFFNKQ